MGRQLVLLSALLIGFFMVAECQDCPRSWRRVSKEGGHTCVKHYNTPMTYSRARAFCRTVNATLLRAKGRDFNRAVWLAHHPSLGHLNWVGVTDQVEDGEFRYDNEQIAQTADLSWAGGEPNGHRRENCAAMKKDDGNWWDVPCDYLYPFLCEIQRKCPTGMFGSEHSATCFKYYSDPLTYEDARRSCHNKGMWLAEPKTIELYALAIGSKPYGVNAWIGLTDKKREDIWKFHMSGEDVAYGNWAAGEPNNIGNEDCVGANYAGAWNDFPCGVSQGYICERGNTTAPMTPCRNDDMPQQIARHLGVNKRLVYFNPQPGLVYAGGAALAQCRSTSLARVECHSNGKWRLAPGQTCRSSYDAANEEERFLL